jgi:hypothetical protein
MGGHTDERSKAETAGMSYDTSPVAYFDNVQVMRLGCTACVRQAPCLCPSIPWRIAFSSPARD